jgi:hypothetical protein
MSTESFSWRVERFAHFNGHLFARGWAFHHDMRLRSLVLQLPSGPRMRTSGYGLASPDVAAVHSAAHGDRTEACRFSIVVPIPTAEEAMGSKLLFRGKGRDAVIDAPTEELGTDPFHQLFPKFQQMVSGMQDPKIVEIGSRARSEIVNTAWLPQGADYVGFDIVDGPNVHVVGDAHELGTHFESSSVDAVFSISTLEHLAMPWRVVAQINSIMRTGGVAYLASHQAWPLHDSPWDYWRFSTGAWRALLNADTGFEVVDTAMGDRAALVADYLSPATAGLDLQPAFLGSAVIARKTHSVDLSWEVDPSLIGDEPYPG